MRILILGAGGPGGDFGGRLAQGGADVTFLVRAPRQARLQAHGLSIRSPLGDADLQVATLTTGTLQAEAARAPFDLVLLSCKAYDLDSAIEAVAPAMDEATTLMPILNGLLHYPVLDARFGRARVLGGLCFLSSTLAADGSIRHLGRPAWITFGEREGGRSARVDAFAALCAQAGIDHRPTADIGQEQWIKFSFLATLAAGTCLMRASIGAIVAGEGGVEFMAALHEECLAVAAAEGQPVPSKARDIARASLVQAGSDVKASMLRDLEAGNRVEAAHIVGDMWQRARRHGQHAPLLQAAWVNLQAYQR